MSSQNSDGSASARRTCARGGAGLSIPRGALLTYTATADELAELEERSQERGIRAHATISRNLRRSAQEAATLQALTEWLATHRLNVFGTVTYSDDYAHKHRVYSLNAGLDDVWRGLTQALAFPGKFVLAGEWHPSGRKVPHVHLALEARYSSQEQLCEDLRHHFDTTCGRSRFEPMRDVTTATLYALKDTVKASAQDADAVRYRLWHPKRHGRS
jgi:hypothetical protein